MEVWGWIADRIRGRTVGMHPRMPARLVLLLVVGWLRVQAAQPAAPADARLAAYFAAEVERLTTNTLADTALTRGEWEARRETWRRELFDMLGLWPLPERTPLNPVVTGRVEHGDFTVENLHFQALPGLYVTANLYRPPTVERPLPAILYVSGHASVRTIRPTVVRPSLSVTVTWGVFAQRT